MEVKRKNFAKLIDHTAVKIDATEEAIKKVCEEAKQWGFGAVAINSSYLPLAKRFLGDTGIKLVSTVSFPFGCALTESKVHEARSAIEKGADELDMVMNLGKFKSKDYEGVREDIKVVVENAKKYGSKFDKKIIIKVIIEAPLLSKEEIQIASKIVKEAKADFVKTSTGFGPRGTTPEDVKLIRNAVGKDMGVKAAGGIRNFEGALKMIEAGANRIGASHSIEMVKGWHP
jgi:deoxyribose-phosphate aldolase